MGVGQGGGQEDAAVGCRGGCQGWGLWAWLHCTQGAGGSHCHPSPLATGVKAETRGEAAGMGGDRGTCAPLRMRHFSPPPPMQTEKFKVTRGCRGGRWQAAGVRPPCSSGLIPVGGLATDHRSWHPQASSSTDPRYGWGCANTRRKTWGEWGRAAAAATPWPAGPARDGYSGWRWSSPNLRRKARSEAPICIWVQIRKPRGGKTRLDLGGWGD